ncbi:MAG: hypothetical protein J5992_03715 [Oscillospiraceae bacterium]|nr:hypothetical protein [Oscillospiraceae bacterium]
MYFIENIDFWHENVLSHITRVEEKSILSLVEYIKSNIDALNLEIKGNIFFRIFEIAEAKNYKILGIEVLIPVDKTFENTCHYVYKPIFKIENSVFSKFNGKPEEIVEAGRKFENYAIKQNKSILTDVYYVIKNIFDDGSCILDMYIGSDRNDL